MKISVVVCTHNPRKDYLEKTLNALCQQTLRKEKWELLLIDNASDEALTEKWDISWHPNGRIIRENKVGLTYARMRGIKESKGTILIFVDDDNVLKKNYLNESLKICQKKPFIGAFSGECLPVSEGTINKEQAKHLGALAIRYVKQERWFNFPGHSDSMPYGAGMVLRKEVGLKYLTKLKKSKLSKSLDRNGTSLSCHGDLDMASTAFQLNLAVGIFPQIKLHHLIPQSRLREDYLIQLKRDATESKCIYEYLIEKKLPTIPKPLWRSPGRLLLWIRTNSFGRKIMAAERKGCLTAHEKITQATKNK